MSRRGRMAVADIARFPGISFPSNDFFAVRDGRRSPLFFVDVDLATARSVAAGTQAVLPIAANFLYVDQRQNTGFATVHFQDVNPLSAPVTLFAGALWKVPFTQFAIENTAQPGQSLRLIYGVDVDALPISAAGVTVLNAININDVISSACQILFYTNAVEPVGTTVTQMLSPATNVNGVAVREYEMINNAGGGGSVTQGLIAALTAPVGFGAKANAWLIDRLDNSAVAPFTTRHPALNRKIPTGWGLWNVSTVGVAVATVAAYASVEVL